MSAKRDIRIFIKSERYEVDASLFSEELSQDMSVLTADWLDWLEETYQGCTVIR